MIDIERGYNAEEIDLYNEYPRLFAVATSFSLNKKYFDDIFSKMDDSLWLQTQTDHSSRELHMRMILVRLGHLKESYDLRVYKNSTEQELQELFGRYNVKFVKELLRVL